MKRRRAPKHLHMRRILELVVLIWEVSCLVGSCAQVTFVSLMVIFDFLNIYLRRKRSTGDLLVSNLPRFTVEDERLK